MKSPAVGIRTHGLLKGLQCCWSHKRILPSKPSGWLIQGKMGQRGCGGQMGPCAAQGALFPMHQKPNPLWSLQNPRCRSPMHKLQCSEAFQCLPQTRAPYFQPAAAVPRSSLHNGYNAPHVPLERGHHLSAAHCYRFTALESCPKSIPTVQFIQQQE